MKQTFRLSGRKRYPAITCLVFLVGVTVYFSTHPIPGDSAKGESPIVDAILGLLLVLALGYLWLEALVTRVVANDEGVVFYDLLNRARVRLSYDQIVSYRPSTTTGWALVTQEREFKLPEIEIPEFHRVIVAKIPRALNAKRWQTGQLPPNEEFEELSLFDVERLVAQLLGGAIFGIPLFLISKTTALGYLAASWLPQTYYLKDILGSLSLKSDAASVSWPWRRRRIDWNRVNAIFCHGKGRFRYFVLTSDDASIVIPRTVARDLQPMRKVFYNLPDHTLCVNFDETTRRGYRVRRKKRMFDEALTPQTEIGW